MTRGSDKGNADNALFMLLFSMRQLDNLLIVNH